MHYPRFMPRFPAILLIPTILAAGVLQRPIPIPGLRGTEFRLGFPLALATAYIVAMAVDRLVLPLIRGKGRRYRGQGEAN